MNAARRPRLVLLALFLLFLLPVLLAVAMHSIWWHHHPAGTRNHGVLLAPPVRLPMLAGTDPAGQPWTAADLSGRWTLLGAGDRECAAHCPEWIDLLTRIRQAQGRRRAAVGIVILTPVSLPPPATGAASPGFLRIVTLPPDGMAALEQALPAVPAIYLVDPEGNIILRYAASPDPADPGRDLTRLLTWSRRE